MNPRPVAAPNACHHCGIEQYEHAQRYAEAAGWHQWAEPDQDQIKARMIARRDERLAAKLRRLRQIPAGNIAAREAVMAPEPTDPLRVNTTA